MVSRKKFDVYMESTGKFLIPSFNLFEDQINVNELLNFPI